MSPARTVILIIAASSIVRILFAAAVGLCIDESYIAGVSRRFALSYFDHPPLHIWLVGGWAKLIGDDRAVILRLPFIALFAGSTWLMFRLTARAFGQRAGLWAALALSLAPVLTLSIGSWVLPDGPLMFFALLSIWFVARPIFANSPPDELWPWLAAGAAGGFALLSKYIGVFVFAGVGLFLLTSRPHRRWLGTLGPWLGALIAALLFAPVVVWNAQHGWASFAFQGSRGLPKAFHIEWLLQDIGGQIGYLLPWIAGPLIYVLAQALMRARSDRAGWFFACLAIGPVAAFALLGFWTPVLPHWPMLGWLFTFPLLGRALARLETTHGRGLRRAAGASSAILIAFLALAATQAATGWASRLVPGLLDKDPTLDVLDWRDLKPILIARGLLAPGTIVATPSWIDAGKVNYALGGEFLVLCVSPDPREFAYLQDERRVVGGDAIIVANATRSDWMERVKDRFERVESLDDVILTRAGQPVVTLRIARGVGLHRSLLRQLR